MHEEQRKLKVKQRKVKVKQASVVFTSICFNFVISRYQGLPVPVSILGDLNQDH